MGNVQIALAVTFNIDCHLEAAGRLQNHAVFSVCFIQNPSVHNQLKD